jgi:hypothetical protein
MHYMELILDKLLVFIRVYQRHSVGVIVTKGLRSIPLTFDGLETG